MKSIRNSLEPLESRIAPAAVFPYTDVDGDKVVITTSKGTNADLMGAVTITGGQLQKLDVSTAAFIGTDVSFAVTKAGVGDGLAAVGRIVGGILGKVTVKGDLGEVDANSIGSLVARTMGRYDKATELMGVDGVSTIGTTIGSINIAGDVKGIVIAAAGTIGPVTIGGSLLHGDTTAGGQITAAGIGPVKIGGDVAGGIFDNSGSIVSTGNITSVTVGGSIIGGSGMKSGYIEGINVGTVKIVHNLKGGSALEAGEVLAGTNLGAVTIGGSLIGGSATETGALTSLTGTMGAVKITHDLAGGSGLDSGEINGGGNITSVTIGGSVIGGTNDRSGYITTPSTLGPVTIGHDLIGPSITTGSIAKSAYITADHIVSVTIGGSVLAGLDESAGALTNTASIQALHDIGSITVKGSVRGTNSGGVNIVTPIFSGTGQVTPTATSDLAIGKVSITGTVDYAKILAGYSTALSPTNHNAQIGTVSVGHDWIASSIIAGAKDVNGDGFGTADDALISAGASIASIAKITITGIVEGTAASVGNMDHFAFESHTIGSVKVSGTSYPGPFPTQLSPLTNDFTIRLV